MHAAAEAICFGNARLEIEQRRLLIDGRPAKLGARAFDVLLALIERRDRTVTKDELFEVVWPGAVVEENNLQVHISALRRLLGPQAIATIPGRGYRFTAQIDGSSIKPDAVAAEPRAEPATEELDRLYGREDDLLALDGLLQQHRLVSIVGAGGIGKTRLARAVAAAQREHKVSDVWWVELAQLSDAQLIVGTIAQVLGVRATDDRPVLQTVIALLSREPALLVLDNCEHLLDAVTECVSALLTGTSKLRILVTSQEALRISEEHVYRLTGLPTDSEAGTPAAVALFVARAQAADPRLQPTASNLATSADICRRLDGMPLAIELAAARVRLLGIDGVHERLNERFRLLTGGTRAVLRRHQTLRATLEWSHHLLTADEQAVFRRLGVFVGGFTLELAQAVATDTSIDSWAVLDLLGHLVDKSLVVAEGNEAPRYRLLETTRVFALEQLAAAGETETLLRRHAEALLAFAVHVEAGMWTWSPEAQKRQSAELDNLRAALDWARASPETLEVAYTLFANSQRIWMSLGLGAEGIERALHLLPLPAGLNVETEARFNLALAHFGYQAGRRECFDAAKRAVQLHRSLNDAPRLIDSLLLVALIGANRGEVEQRAAALEEADSLISADAPPRQRAMLALAHARHFLYLGDYEQAVAGVRRQAAICRESGLEWNEQIALTNIAWYGCGLGRLDEAIDILQRVIATLHRINAPYGLGYAEAGLAVAYALRGDREQALAHGRAAVPHMQQVLAFGWLLPCIALLHVQQQGSEANGAALIGYFDAELRDGRGYPPFVIETRNKVMALAEAVLGSDETGRQAIAGAELTEEQALRLAFG